MAKYYDLHNTTEKTKDLTTEIQQQSEIKCSEWVCRYCFPSGLLNLTPVKIPVVSQER
jgi:hypothetical protein